MRPKNMWSMVTYDNVMTLFTTKLRLELDEVRGKGSHGHMKGGNNKRLNQLGEYQWSSHSLWLKIDSNPHQQPYQPYRSFRSTIYHRLTSSWITRRSNFRKNRTSSKVGPFSTSLHVSQVWWRIPSVSALACRVHNFCYKKTPSRPCHWSLSARISLPARAAFSGSAPAFTKRSKSWAIWSGATWLWHAMDRGIWPSRASALTPHWNPPRSWRHPKICDKHGAELFDLQNRVHLDIGSNQQLHNSQVFLLYSSVQRWMTLIVWICSWLDQGFDQCLGGTVLYGKHKRRLPNISCMA